MELVSFFSAINDGCVSWVWGSSGACTGLRHASYWVTSRRAFGFSGNNALGILNGNTREVRRIRSGFGFSCMTQVSPTRRRASFPWVGASDSPGFESAKVAGKRLLRPKLGSGRVCGIFRFKCGFCTISVPELIYQPCFHSVFQCSCITAGVGTFGMGSSAPRPRFTRLSFHPLNHFVKRPCLSRSGFRRSGRPDKN